MKNRRIIFNVLFASALLALSSLSYAQSRREFVQQYKHIAIREMERTGIPASITLAQGILESACGESELARKANNHFGIKCHDWTGDTYTMDDDAKDECFRKYKHPEQSWIDHSEFLLSRPRYAGLFRLKSTDYKAWARGLKAAGYATNPKYADLLIRIIEEERLHQYDRYIKHPVGGGGELSMELKPVRGHGHGHHGHEESGYRKREEMRNGILCIEARAGDSYAKIADYYGIKVKRLMQYNDRSDAALPVGQMVYLKRKKSRAARGYEFHRVKPGDDLYGISQQYGVRLKNLCRNNYLSPETQLNEGEKIYLRKKAPLF